jgi:hypothetical protein
MLDDLQQLRESQELRQLLAHYAQGGALDREAWQDRLMELPGVPPRDLVRLHGQLIGYSWIEQNTGCTPVLKPGMVPGCYRITPAGQRALRHVGRKQDEEAVAA